MPSNKKPIAVRLDDATREQVEALAEKYHVSVATIGIWAFNALLEYVRLNNGKVTLPLNFADIIAESPLLTAYKDDETPAPMAADGDEPYNVLDPTSQSEESSGEGKKTS